jgi:hypothetical protein
MEDRDEPRNRWALLIGIDRYPKFSSREQLHGCVNDVEVMKDALLRRFGFSEGGMTVLMNEQATRDGMLAAMDQLVDRAGPEDIVVFHYSGHGSQQTDGPEHDEASGWDQTLVPSDSARIPLPNRDITDDEIQAWLRRLTARSPYVTLIFDCCHSGTMDRTRTRTIPVDKRPYTELAAHQGKPAGPVFRDGGGEGRNGWLPASDQCILFAACASSQSALEIQVGEGAAQVSHGQLTYHMVRELMSPGFQGGTCTELFERMLPSFSADLLKQTPQLSGPRHRRMFGVAAASPMSYVPVLEMEGTHAVLGAGAVAGLKPGSRWKVYPPGAEREGEAAALVTVQIDSVGVSTSRATVVESHVRSAVPPGARAVEVMRSLESARLTVAVPAPTEHPAPGTLARRVADSQLLRLAGPGELPDARIELDGESWVALDANGDPLAPAIPRSLPRALEIVAENLERLARLRGVLAVRNDGSPLAGQVDFDLFRLEEGRCMPAAEENGHRVFSEGDAVVLEIRNRSRRPLYVYLLDIGLTGAVSPVFPPLGSHELLEIGNTVRVGDRPGEEMKLFIPKDFGPREGRETLKLFASTAPADFSVMFQPGMRCRGMGGSLADVLGATFGGGGYAALRCGGEDWTTVERTFLLRAR